MFGSDDVAACQGRNCKKRESCHRYLIHMKKNQFQSYSSYDEDKKPCEAYRKTNPIKKAKRVKK